MAQKERIDGLNGLGEKYIGLPFCFGLPTGKASMDSGDKCVSQALEEARKIDYYFGMARATALKADLAFERDNNYPEALKLGSQAIELYKRTATKTDLHKAYFRLGASLYALSRFDASIRSLDSSYELSKNAGDQLYAIHSILLSAYVYDDEGDYENAFDRLLKFDQQIGANSNSPWKADELWLLGSLFADIKDYPSAVKYYRQISLDAAFAKSVQLHNMLANAFLLNKQFDSAQKYFNLVAVDTSTDRARRFYLSFSGEYYLLTNRYDKALPDLLRSLNYNKQDNDVNQIMKLMVDISQAFLGLKKNDSAFKYAHEALVLAKGTHARRLIRDACEILYSTYEAKHQSDSAYFYYKQYSAMNDSVISDRIKGKLAGYSFEKKIKSLNDENELQRMRLQGQSFLRNVLIAGIVALSLLALIIFRNISLKRKNEKMELEHELELQKLESERKETSLHQKSAELEMQALRAQMNPHFIFNSLNSINRFILQNNKQPASEYLIKFSKLMRIILQNSQYPLVTLESELECVELYLELEALRFDQRFTYSIAVSDDLDADVLKVPPLIIQPYAENAIWHGLMHLPKSRQGGTEGGHLQIEATAQGEYLILKVTDNGVGRQTAAALSGKVTSGHKSMGLRITAGRLAMIQHSDKTESPVTINDLVYSDGTSAGTEVIIKIHLTYD